MFCEPGFVFDTVTSKNRHPASSFFNAGSITGLDTPAEGIEVIVSGTSIVVEPPTLSPLGINNAIILIQVNATNITNSGIVSVGDLGRLSVSGQIVNLANGALIAGTDSDSDTNATSGRGVIEGTTVNGTA